MLTKVPVNSQSTRKMLREMSNRDTLFWIGVAFVLHAVIAVGTSWGYVKNWWSPPAPVEEVAATQAAPATNAATAPAAPAAPTVASATTKPKTADGVSDDPAAMAARKDNPVIKSITETAPAKAIPNAPTRSGLDLDSLEPGK